MSGPRLRDIARALQTEPEPKAMAALADYRRDHPDDLTAILLEADVRIDLCDLRRASNDLEEFRSLAPTIESAHAERVEHRLATVLRGIDDVRAATVEPRDAHATLVRRLISPRQNRVVREVKVPEPGLRVTLIVRSLGPGGVEGQAVYAAGALHTAGMDVTVLHDERVASRPEFVTALAKQDIPVHTFASFRSTDPPDPTAAAVAALTKREGYEGLDQALAHLDPDVVEVFGKPGFIDWVGLFCLRAGVPRTVVCAPSLSPPDRPDLIARPNYVRRVQFSPDRFASLLSDPSVRFVNKCDAGLESYREWLGGLPESACTVRNVIDFAALRDLVGQSIDPPWPVGAPVMGGVMALYDVKRPLLWVDVAKEVARRRPQVHFALVGDGAMRDEVAAAATELGNRFHLLGHQSPVMPWMAAMTTMVITSVSEGICNVMLEATAAGRFVVSSPVGGIPEAVIEGRTAHLVADHGHPDGYVDAVLAALDDPPTIEGDPVVDAFLDDRFSTEAFTRHTLAVYR